LPDRFFSSPLSPISAHLAVLISLFLIFHQGSTPPTARSLRFPRRPALVMVL
jgi:hypothetical protein